MRLPLLIPQFFQAVQEVWAGSTPGLGVVYGLGEWRWARAIADAVAVKPPNWAIYSPTQWGLGLAVADKLNGTTTYLGVLYSPTEALLAAAIAPSIGSVEPIGVTPLLAAIAGTAVFVASFALQGVTPQVASTASTANYSTVGIRDAVTAQLTATASAISFTASFTGLVGTASAASTASIGTGISGTSLSGTTPQLTAAASTRTGQVGSVMASSSTPSLGAIASTGTSSATGTVSSSTPQLTATASTATGLAAITVSSSAPQLTAAASTGTKTASFLATGSTPQMAAISSTGISSATITAQSTSSQLAAAASTGTGFAAIAVTSNTPSASAAASAVTSTAAFTASSSTPSLSAIASAGTGSTQDAAVSAYQNNVALAGGTVDATTLGYLDTFVKGCKTDGTWTALYDVGVFCGSNLAAALVKLKTPASATSFTNTGFVEADYSQSTGLNPGSSGASGSGGTKYLTTGVAPNATSGIGPYTFHVSFYSRTNSTGILAETGAFDGTNYAGLYTCYLASSVNHGYFDAFQQDANGEIDVSPVTNSQGMFLGSRTSSSAFYFARNGSSIGSATTNSGSKPTTQMGIFCYAGTGSSGTTNRICAYYSMGTGLTTTQASSYYSRVQALQTSLGRQV